MAHIKVVEVRAGCNLGAFKEGQKQGRHVNENLRTSVRREEGDQATCQKYYGA